MEKYTPPQQHLTQHTESLTRWLNYTQLTISWMTSRDCQDATEVAFMHVTFFFRLEKGLTPDVKMVPGENILCLTSFRWGLNRGPAPPGHQWSQSTSYKSEGVNLKPVFLIPYSMCVSQSCPTLCDPVDCSPPGSSVHGILQARILEWVAVLSISMNKYILSYCSLPQPLR